MKKFVSIVLFVITSICGFAQNHKSDKKPGRPNVIIILTDDQGYGDVGFNGCKDIPTPAIDQIAQNGTVFTRGYVSYAVCGPSRAGLITGRYQDRFGYSRNPLYVPNDPEVGLSLQEETIADVLQRTGYKTMAIGKWHLGAHESLRPLKRGFNEFFGFLGGGHQYFPESWNIGNADSAKGEGQSYKTKITRNNTIIEETEYLTDALSREAVSFIDRNKKTPFFLYLAYNAPHTPLQASDQYLSRFQHIKDEKRRKYAAMVSAVDDGVGRVMQKLKDLNLEENTMVFFLSDNGGPESDNASDNGLLRGGKGGLFEGGIRVPFAMQWTGHVPANTRYDKPVISLDIFSTAIANISGTTPPTKKLDGVDLVPYLIGRQKGTPHDQLFWRQFDKQNFAVVNGDGQKLFVDKDGKVSLYDLNNDVAEQNDKAVVSEKKAKELDAKRKLWEKEMVKPAFLGLTQEAEYYQKKGISTKLK